VTDSESEKPESPKAEGSAATTATPAAEAAGDDAAVEESEPFERRSAQAMVATYLQMTRYAELASMLQKARLRSTEHRVTKAEDLSEVERLQRQLEAQQNQGETIELALDRFRRHAGDLRAFSEAGLTPEDFKILGIDELLGDDGESDASTGVEDAR